MLEIRIHGRGGQGSAVAVQILATAAFEEGYYGRASIAVGGGERRGAPVFAFCKIDKEKIREQTKIDKPDLIVVQDVTLLDTVDVFAGLKPDGIVLINTEKTPEELGISGINIKTVPASRIATEIIGVPITNTTLLGAFAAITGIISIDSIKKVIQDRFPGGRGKKNAEAAQKTYDFVRERT